MLTNAFKIFLCVDAKILISSSSKSRFFQNYHDNLLCDVCVNRSEIQTGFFFPPNPIVKTGTSCLHSQLFAIDALITFSLLHVLEEFSPSVNGWKKRLIFGSRSKFQVICYCERPWFELQLLALNTWFATRLERARLCSQSNWNRVDRLSLRFRMQWLWTCLLMTEVKA